MRQVLAEGTEEEMLQRVRQAQVQAEVQSEHGCTEEDVAMICA